MSPKEHSERLEELRREPVSKTVTNNPVPNGFHEPIDWGNAGNKIDVAVRHLDECLANKQAKRSYAALQALKEGAAELELWMKANGYV